MYYVHSFKYSSRPSVQSHSPSDAEDVPMIRPATNLGVTAEAAAAAAVDVVMPATNVRRPESDMTVFTMNRRKNAILK